MGRFKELLDKYLPENDKREDFPYWEESIANSGYTERDFRLAAGAREHESLDSTSVEQVAYAGHIALSGQDENGSGE